MQKMYKGKPVIAIRPAKPGDKGYLPPQPDMILIKLENQEKIAVLASEVTDGPDYVPVMQPPPVTKPSTEAPVVTAPSTKSFFGGLFKK